MLYWIFMGIICFLFATTDLLLYLRSKNLNITRRSPWLLHLSLWGNLIEIISISSIVPTLSAPGDISPLLSSLRDCGVIIGHYTFFLPYLLRAYRVYLVFNLEKNSSQSGENFEKVIHKTRQLWLLKFFMYLMIFPVILCICLIFAPIQDYFPITNKDHSAYDDSIAVCLYVFVCFIEQLALILATNLVRNVDEKFNMWSELVWVCGIWAISPLFSTFVDSERTVWFSACIIRNILVFLRTDVVSLVRSFQSTAFEASLTIDMLNSLEIILENERTLEFFEMFLKAQPDCSQKDSGYSLLCLYKELECRIYKTEGLMYSYIEVEMTKYSMLNTLDKYDTNSSPEKLERYKQSVFRVIQDRYYKEFLKSEECCHLRKMINKEEAIAFRVTQTSFLPVTKRKTEEIFIQ